jgi:hypothetical protein
MVKTMFHAPNATMVSMTGTDYTIVSSSQARETDHGLLTHNGPCGWSVSEHVVYF